MIDFLHSFVKVFVLQPAVEVVKLFLFVLESTKFMRAFGFVSL